MDVSPRDLVFTLPADEAASPSASPRQLAATNLRYGGISWGDGDLALIYERLVEDAPQHRVHVRAGPARRRPEGGSGLGQEQGLPIGLGSVSIQSCSWTSFRLMVGI